MIEKHNQVWIWLFPGFGVAGITGWAVSATAWLSAWGPIAWVAVPLLSGIVAALAAASAYALVGLGRNKRAQAKFQELLATSTRTVNPLAARFLGERINLSDLRIHASTFDFPQRGKVFTDCVIVGPGTVVFIGCNIDPLNFPGCNLAKYNQYGHCVPDVLFQQCAMVNCTFVNVTAFVNDADASIIRQRLPTFKFTEESAPLEGGLALAAPLPLAVAGTEIGPTDTPPP